jgi:hypothetical protein
MPDAPEPVETVDLSGLHAAVEAACVEIDDLLSALLRCQQERDSLSRQGAELWHRADASASALTALQPVIDEMRTGSYMTVTHGRIFSAEKAEAWADTLSALLHQVQETDKQPKVEP